MISAPNEQPKGQSVGPSAWIKAGVLLLALAVAGIGYLVYQESQPDLEDAFREAAEVQFGEAAVTVKVDLLLLQTGQEQFYEQNGRYAESVEEFELEFWSDDVELEIIRWDEDGWKAQGVHKAAGITCVADHTTPIVGGRYLADCQPT